MGRDAIYGKKRFFLKILLDSWGSEIPDIPPNAGTRVFGTGGEFFGAPTLKRAYLVGGDNFKIS